MRKLILQSFALIVAASTAFAGFLSPDHPDVLTCKASDVGGLSNPQVFLFLSGVAEDGSALYQSLGTASISAIYDQQGNLTGLADKICEGLSLKELEAQGRTRSLK